MSKGGHLAAPDDVRARGAGDHDWVGRYPTGRQSGLGLQQGDQPATQHWMIINDGNSPAGCRAHADVPPLRVAAIRRVECRPIESQLPQGLPHGQVRALHEPDEFDLLARLMY